MQNMPARIETNNLSHGLWEGLKTENRFFYGGWGGGIEQQFGTHLSHQDIREITKRDSFCFCLHLLVFVC